MDYISGWFLLDMLFMLLCCFNQAKPILNRGEYEKLVDPRLGGAYDVTQLQRFSLAASLCIRESALWRPTMTEVANSMLMFN